MLMLTQLIKICNQDILLTNWERYIKLVDIMNRYSCKIWSLIYNKEKVKGY